MALPASAPVQVVWASRKCMRLHLYHAAEAMHRAGRHPYTGLMAPEFGRSATSTAQHHSLQHGPCRTSCSVPGGNLHWHGGTPHQHGPGCRWAAPAGTRQRCGARSCARMRAFWWPSTPGGGTWTCGSASPSGTSWAGRHACWPHHADSKISYSGCSSCRTSRNMMYPSVTAALGAPGV